MQSVKDSIKSEYNRFGIDSTKKEKCPVCNYGSRITVIVNGQEKSHCKYCEDRKLVEKMNIPETEEEYKRLKTNDKTSYFMRLPNDIRNAKSEEHTSELQSRFDLVCRLLLEKKNLKLKTVVAIKYLIVLLD